MTKLDGWRLLIGSWQKATMASGKVFLRDVGHGLFEVSHNSLALLGLAVVGMVLFTAGRADVREGLETQALNWLQARQVAARAESSASGEPSLAEPDAIARATASDPRDLTRSQAAVAGWLSRHYHVAPEPISRLVQEAWRVGDLTHLDPTLILAVMAVESSFNPFAQSPVGAQGLMQVMTKVHDDKYEAFGGSHAAFDPVTNLRVGVQVLKECIARAGSLEAGLRYYVGAANSDDDGGYAHKVLVEQNVLRQLAGQKPLALPPRRPPADVMPAARVADADLSGAGSHPAVDPAAGLMPTAADAAPAPQVTPPTKPRDDTSATPERIALLR